MESMKDHFESELSGHRAEKFLIEVDTEPQDFNLNASQRPYRLSI
jgi:hypothetical protein